MFYRLNNYLKGYIHILIEGLFPERFINLSTKNKISLWNIRRKTNHSVTANIGINDFKKIRPFAKNSKCKIHILKKHGLQFFIYRHKKRKALIIGFAVFFIFLWFLTKFVWIIDITGNDKIPDKVILEYAKKAGLQTGMPIVKVDSSSIQNYIMTNMDEVSFVSVNKNGTIVSIDIREREEKREHFDKNTPSNIIASQSGVIESILVQSGTAAVKKGDVVYKGQLLVSGASDNKYLGIKYSNSDADIKARVWHEKTVEIPY
ncbi:MAG: sporulation protein YqfD, partial [Clostridia bacterium]|nr:sporulation protein YqfD [Clostridia bacterium]